MEDAGKSGGSAPGPKDANWYEVWKKTFRYGITYRGLQEFFEQTYKTSYPLNCVNENFEATGKGNCKELPMENLLSYVGATRGLDIRNPRRSGNVIPKKSLGELLLQLPESKKQNP
jgi:hypothetical protein